jgi:hypothetical protein
VVWRGPGHCEAGGGEKGGKGKVEKEEEEEEAGRVGIKPAEEEPKGQARYG